MRYNRRDFIKKAMAGATVTGLGGYGILSTAAQPGYGKGGGGAPLLETEEERRKLISQAHFGPKTKAVSKKGLAICSHPLATRAGVNILKSGGNACDAALAMSVMQTVVEPHMTGITGILSMLYYDAATGKTSYMNGNMNAPLKPLIGFNQYSLSTGLGVGVPGFWGGFEAALERHGTKSKKEIMAEAIQYARQGFEIHPFLWGEMFEQCHLIGKTKAGREIFMPDNYLLRPGDMIYQKRAADTLERLAEEGNAFFYHGDFAKDYCKTVQEAGGVISMEDMKAYKVRWVEPAWGTYHGYKIAASPPPDNGGTHIIEALNMLEFLDVKRLGP
ncbi:MAG: gamma-glutamyltransferase, partial [Candidatus Aminicenantes bacterium]|nr:gamma-glutamyltransferase [Candidatus Aminicenantes bacterium]